MSLKDLTKEELEEMFGLFMFNLSERLEIFIEKAEQQNLNLDYSLNSLHNLEEYLSVNKVDKDSDDVNKAAAYFGEVVRLNYGGIWKCSLDIKNNSLYYGKPVISGLTIPEDLELSPFDSVLTYVIRPRKDHFLKVIDSYVGPEDDDLDDFPTEED
jgi:hypothetical protein